MHETKETHDRLVTTDYGTLDITSRSRIRQGAYMARGQQRARIDHPGSYLPSGLH